MYVAKNSYCYICTDGLNPRYDLFFLLVQYACSHFFFSFLFSSSVYSMMHCVDVCGFISRQTDPDPVFRTALPQNCSLSSSNVVIELIDEGYAAKELLCSLAIESSCFTAWNEFQKIAGMGRESIYGPESSGQLGSMSF